MLKMGAAIILSRLYFCICIVLQWEEGAPEWAMDSPWSDLHFLRFRGSNWHSLLTFFVLTVLSSSLHCSKGAWDLPQVTVLRPKQPIISLKDCHTGSSDVINSGKLRYHPTAKHASCLLRAREHGSISTVYCPIPSWGWVDERAALTRVVLFPLGMMAGYNRAQSDTEIQI